LIPGTSKKAGLYLKKAITMALFGDYYRKKVYVALGESNCGKGVSVGALKQAFCGYVDEFTANELLDNPNNSQDQAIRPSWLRG
jgi:hypothetical protein